MGWLVVGALTLTLVAGWLAMGARWPRRRSRSGMPEPREPVFTQQPELAWVARANSALAAWLRRSGDGAVSALVLDPRVPEVLHRVVIARLTTTGHGLLEHRTEVERLDDGVLVAVGTTETQVALLLGSERGVAQARRDLEALAGVLRASAGRRASASDSTASEESFRGLAAQLAFELERRADAESVVTVRRVRGVQVVATSASADPHLLRRYAVPYSTVDLVAQGRITGAATSWDPLGALPADRRARTRRGFVFPIADAEEQAFAAAILWTRDGSEPRSAIRGRIESLLRASGPRLRAALRRLDLEDHAARDPLTGLLNRGGLQERMSLVSQDRGAVLACDLDNFKRLNETLGQLAGEAALGRVAATIEDAVRAQDAVARLGGTEFAVWLPGTGLDHALQVAERIRARIADLWWSWQGEPWFLSVSVGVAAWPDTTPSRDSLLPQAGAAVSKAKQAGRNRVAAAG